MRLINASYEILSNIDSNQILKNIETAGRTCYKSEDKITETSCIDFCKMLLSRNHEAMIEHGGMISVKFIVDRGVSHEIVRHRLFSFAQESTRYCNYAKDKFDNQITFIIPNWMPDVMPGIYTGVATMLTWVLAMEQSEIYYNRLISNGWQPQQARSVLPNSLKTEVVVSGNPREWRHFFKLRTATVAHPQMREVAIPLLKEMQERIPILFDDIEIK